MSIDLLGFGNADNAVTVRPARTIVRGATDTWAKDCSDPDAQNGTALIADFFNDFLAQFRTALRNSGIVLDNADDMLWRAMQSLGIRYGVDTGAAGALTVAFSPAVTSLYAGLAVLVNAAQDCPGATNFTPNAQATKSVVWPDASPLSTGDYKAGSILLLVYDGAKWQMIFKLNAGAAAASQFVPGCIYMWPSDDVPTGTYLCDGAEKNRTTDARLFGKIGTIWGPGNGTSTFNLPNLLGYFPRFASLGSGVDPDAASRTNRGDGVTGDHVGTKQGAAAGAINITSGSITISDAKNRGRTDGNTREIGNGGTGNPAFQVASLVSPGPDGAQAIDILGDVALTGNSGSAETRPKNVALMPVIAY
jgi:microcystin-dependent protein